MMMNDGGDDDEPQCWWWDWRFQWWWWWTTVMEVCFRWWKFVSDVISGGGVCFWWWSLFPNGDGSLVCFRCWKFVSGGGSLFPTWFLVVEFVSRRWWKFGLVPVMEVCSRLMNDDEFVLFCLFPPLVFFRGVGSNYVGLDVNGLDLCRVHKDSLCMITTPYTTFI